MRLQYSTQVCISTLAQAFKVWNKMCSDCLIMAIKYLGLTKLGLYWNIHFFPSTYRMQTKFHIYLNWWCGLVVEPSPSSAQGPGIDYRHHHHHQNQEQTCLGISWLDSQEKQQQQQKILYKNSQKNLKAVTAVDSEQPFSSPSAQMKIMERWTKTNEN